MSATTNRNRALNRATRVAAALVRLRTLPFRQPPSVVIQETGRPGRERWCLTVVARLPVGNELVRLYGATLVELLDMLAYFVVRMDEGFNPTWFA